MRSEGLRLEIQVNGKRRCIAGTVGPGSLEAGLVRYRSAEATAREPAESAQLMVHGSRTVDHQYVRWFLDELKAGDEVVIRILEAGDCDEPVTRTSAQPE
jgi:hypothetical protein